MSRRRAKSPQRRAAEKPQLKTHPSERRADVGHRRCETTFAALGDGTRLTLISKLSSGEPNSISRLASGSGLTRQAITKHLRVLEGAGLVHSIRRGRESLFELDPKPILELKDYLEKVSEHWDASLARLKKFVEE